MLKHIFFNINFKKNYENVVIFIFQLYFANIQQKNEYLRIKSVFGTIFKNKTNIFVKFKIILLLGQMRRIFLTIQLKRHLPHNDDFYRTILSKKQRFNIFLLIVSLREYPYSTVSLI